MNGKIRTIASILLLAMLLFLLLIAVSRGQTPEIVASGGPYSLEKTVVAGGGRDFPQPLVNAAGTAGQAVAGQTSSGGQYNLYSGFWTPDSFVPTAATAVLGGRVRTASGQGIRNARVTIAFPNGITRTVLTGTFGYYRFTEIPVGETYVLSVAARRFSFAANSQVREVFGDLQYVDFVADAN